MTADLWIQKLGMKPHPEGGFFAETYRNSRYVSFVNGPRSMATSIYFLLRSQDISHFHQLYSDEIWYFHSGSPVLVHQFHKNNYQKYILGPESDHDLQVVIKAGTIFGAEVLEESSYCLMGCMVNPGFDFSDFRMMDREELHIKFPDHEELINRLTVQ
jgi:hypothetical protein